MKTITMKISLLVLLLILILPVGVFAQPSAGTGAFIPCDGGAANPCTFYDLIQLVQNVLNWVVLVSFPLSIITFSWAGFIFLTTGIVDKRSEAKKMLWKVVIGFVIILSAWIIVRTITSVLLKPGIADQFIKL